MTQILDLFRSHRAAHPNCALLVLSDLGSGTVLAAEGALAYPQEYLDAISAAAMQALDLAGPTARFSAFATPSGTRLFLRTPSLGKVALTCLCAPTADIDQLLQGLGRLTEVLNIQDIAA